MWLKTYCHVYSSTVSVTIYDMFTLKQFMSYDWFSCSVRGPYRLVTDLQWNCILLHVALCVGGGLIFYPCSPIWKSVGQFFFFAQDFSRNSPILGTAPSPTPPHSILHIYIYMCVCVCVCVYTHAHIHYWLPHIMFLTSVRIWKY